MTKSLHRHYKSHGKERRKRCVFRRLQKTGRDGADVTWRGRSFQVRVASNSESRTSYVFWCTTSIPVRLHNIWVTVSPRSLHPGTGTDSDRVTRLTTYMYCREHALSLANVFSTTPVRPPGTLCHLTYRTLLTLTHSRNDLKLFCLIVRTDLLLLLYIRRSWTVRRAAPYKSLIVFVFVFHTYTMTTTTTTRCRL